MLSTEYIEGDSTSLPRGSAQVEGGNNMLKVQVCAAHVGGFLGPNSLKRSLVSRFSVNIGGYSRNWRKMAKNGWFSAKIHHKSWYDSKFR